MDQSKIALNEANSSHEDRVVKQYWLRGVLGGALLIFAGTYMMYLDGVKLASVAGIFNMTVSIGLILAGLFYALMPVIKRYQIKS